MIVFTSKILEKFNEKTSKIIIYHDSIYNMQKYRKNGMGKLLIIVLHDTKEKINGKIEWGKSQ